VIEAEAARQDGFGSYARGEVHEFCCGHPSQFACAGIVQLANDSTEALATSDTALSKSFGNAKFEQVFDLSRL
jgi:hypothetical protein